MFFSIEFPNCKSFLTSTTNCQLAEDWQIWKYRMNMNNVHGMRSRFLKACCSTMVRVAYRNQTASHNNIRNCINLLVDTSWSEVSQDCTSLAICWYGWQDYDLGLPQSAEVRVSKRIKRAVRNERWEKEKREDNLKDWLICWSNMYLRMVRTFAIFANPLLAGIITTKDD